MIRIWLIAVFVVLSGCGGGGGGSSSGTTPATTTTTTGDSTASSSLSFGIISDDASACPAAISAVTITGTVSYERVPFSSTLGRGLDYNNIQTNPVRGVVIQALGDGNCVMATSSTSATGSYSLAVTQNSSKSPNSKYFWCYLGF